MRKRFLQATLVALAVLAISACDRIEQTYFTMPPELHGCKVFTLRDGLDSITVLACPHSDCESAKYMSGKVSENTAVCTQRGYNNN